MLWIWSALITPIFLDRTTAKVTATAGITISAAIIGIEHQMPPTFVDQVSETKMIQRSWLNAYNATQSLGKSMREQGKEVNIIFSRESWLSGKRHLGKLTFNRLIEFNPENQKFTIEEGVNKEGSYKPKLGDLLITIDTDNSSLNPLLDKFKTKTLYTDPGGAKNGRIFEIIDQ